MQRFKLDIQTDPVLSGIKRGCAPGGAYDIREQDNRIQPGGGFAVDNLLPASQTLAGIDGRRWSLRVIFAHPPVGVRNALPGRTPMLRTFRRSLLTTGMMMMPLLLTACGDESGGDKKKLAMIIPLMMLFFTVSLAQQLSKGKALRSLNHQG